jgi:hypothetical protein
MQTRWDYAPEFHARLPRHWPTLAFACSVNGEMGDFGGIIVSLNGQSHNLVRDYDVGYVRRTHSREITRLLRRWNGFLTEGRDYCLVPRRPWERPSMPFDAHFNDDFMFYFRSRESIVKFKNRYKSMMAMRRIGNEWTRTRLP